VSEAEVFISDQLMSSSVATARQQLSTAPPKAPSDINSHTTFTSKVNSQKMSASMPNVTSPSAFKFYQNSSSEGNLDEKSVEVSDPLMLLAAMTARLDNPRQISVSEGSAQVASAREPANQGANATEQGQELESEEINEASTESSVRSLDAGLSYVLDAPTSALVPVAEDPLTYLGCHQMYGLTLGLSEAAATSGHSPAGGGRPTFRSESAISVISVQFRDKDRQATVEDALLHWELWLTRQPTPKIRAIDTKHESRQGVVDKVKYLAHNALQVKWEPNKSPAKFYICVRALSTDFSDVKGIKGTPLNIQIDTYAGEDTDMKTVLDRAFCQIKTFVEYGANRKTKVDLKRLKNLPPNSVLPVQKETTFIRTVGNEKEPINRTTVLFKPCGLDDPSDDDGGELRLPVQPRKTRGRPRKTPQEAPQEGPQEGPQDYRQTALGSDARGSLFCLETLPPSPTIKKQKVSVPTGNPDVPDPTTVASFGSGGIGFVPEGTLAVTESGLTSTPMTTGPSQHPTSDLAFDPDLPGQIWPLMAIRPHTAIHPSTGNLPAVYPPAGDTQQPAVATTTASGVENLREMTTGPSQHPTSDLPSLIPPGNLPVVYPPAVGTQQPGVATATAPGVENLREALTLSIRQENEMTYTGLFVSSPTLDAFILALAAKYQICARHDVRYVYKKFGRGGIVVNADDDVVTTLEGGAFLMKVLAMGRGPNTQYDIVLIEENNNLKA